MNGCPRQNPAYWLTSISILIYYYAIMSNILHQPVLLSEAIKVLCVDPDAYYIDGTFGRGGHSKAILAQLSAQGRLLALDKDPEAITYAQAHFDTDPRFMVQYTSFSQMAEIVKQQGMEGKVKGILLDLGVSSPQLDNAARGFSFSENGVLDMRMNNQQGETAAEWLQTAKQEDITWVLKYYGEERFAKRIATAIVAYRQQNPITDTKTLVAIIQQAIPVKEKHKHPATRSFQAIRIYINKELQELETVLAESMQILSPQGRLAIISFHSLEDRIVKHFFKKLVQGVDPFPADFPIQDVCLNKQARYIGKLYRANKQELNNNPRSRSAIMRVVEKL